MRTATLATRGVILVAIAAVSSCGIIGPSCLDQQKRGGVTSVSGRVEAGQIASHLVPYDTRGSQNDAHISFSGQGTSSGPRIRVYATLATCDAFVAPPPGGGGSNQGDCAPIAIAGGTLAPDGAIIPTSLTVTGPGNGAPAGFHEYKLFIVGDPEQSASYTISITYFFGPDC